MSDLVADAPGKTRVAAQLGAACRENGFFYAMGHGVDERLQQRLQELSRQFFAQDLDAKLRIRMELGGRAWRGYFRVGDELTSGKPDQKEGLYFGAELPADHPQVLAGTPLSGPNLFPAEPAGFRETVLEYMAALTQVGHRLMAGLALSLNLEESYFADRYTADPLTLFRIFNYPPPPDPALWGVGEHTDYGLLTILLQDDAGGLEVRLAIAMGLRPAAARIVRLQHRRHAGPDDSGTISFDAASRAKPRSARPAFVSVLFRSQLLRAHRADPLPRL